MTMTKNEMREIIAKALPGHNWKHTSLPDFIADSIIDAQAQTGPLDTPTDEIAELRRRLRDAEARAERAEATITAIKAVLP